MARPRKKKGPQAGPSLSVATGAVFRPEGARPGVPPDVRVAELVDAPLDERGRRIALGVLAAFFLVQVAIPLRYYLGDDLYDERFAWRMFSAVRVQECDIAVSETRDGTPNVLSPMTFLPAPWVGLLERSRPAVVHDFLAWRCDTEVEAESVSVRSSCRDASGDPLPAVTRSLTCDGRVYEESVATPEREAP